jgi:TonB family protein
MYIPEEFGNYLLLKKLSEDPLGETFRAGRVGALGMEQVVLLRVFNGKGLDGEKLWSRVSGRTAVQAILKSPNIGNGVDLGRVRSFPYAAYDYISGKSLATLFAQAARQRSPIPTDHALLIAERLALALAAAHESRLQDERVLHGFVVPHLVMISNEGETRLLGFEVAPGLRELAAAGWQDDAIRPYLAPETLAGAPLAKSDDVYSLGAVLFELLTGERLPAASADGHGAWIDGAALANEGTPLPAAIVALLKRSLVGREQRIADAVTWHKTLSKLMIDGHFSPTTFNLAFFMHNLFRDEIERENQEIQAEKKLELPPRPAAPVTAAPIVAAPAMAAQDLREITGVREPTWPGTRAQVAKEAEPSRKPLWIGIAAAVLVALAVGGYFLFGRSGGGKKAGAAGPAPAASPTTQPAAAGGTVPPAGATASQAGLTPEEIQAQIQQMFEAKQKEMEAQYQTKYDDRIRQLQRQLEDSRRAAAEPPKQPPDYRPSSQEPAPAPAEVRTTQRPDPAATSPTQPSAPAPQPAASSPQASDREDKPAASVPAPANPAPVQSAAPRPQQLQVGDLVQAGAGVVAPKLVSQPDPRYPPAARRLNRAATVDIKVLVDERGRVQDAELLGAKAGFGFDESALDSAKRAVFQPATKDGIRVKMWRTVRVNFKPPL